MRNKIHHSTFFLTVYLFLSFSLYSQDFKAGFAEKDITPKPGMEQPGGYGKSLNSGNVHDSLKARAAVFDDGSNIVAIVGIDASSIGDYLVSDIRKQIEKNTGIPANAILIAASHTHSGGPLDGTRKGEFDHASNFIQDLAYNHSTYANITYQGMVKNAVVNAVKEAYSTRKPVLASVGYGHEDKASFNRRFYMKNGETWTHPNDFGTFGNSDILKVAGPIDPEVGVIGVWDENNTLVGCIVNYANHCTNGAPGISADYVYYLEQTIRGVMGEQAIVVFLNGASGDVTQVDNLSAAATEFGLRSSRFVGTSVGAEALKVLTKAEPGKLLPIKNLNRQLTIPRRIPSPDRVEKSNEMVKQPSEEVGHTEWTFAKEIVLADALIEKEPNATFEIQAIQVGPAVFITNPAELFCQIGLDIKERSLFPYTFVVELANGSIGYVPTREAFNSYGGGYETRLTSYSNLEIDAGTHICSESIELVNSLKLGEVPLPPQKKPFKGPWSYGNVKPEWE